MAKRGSKLDALKKKVNKESEGTIVSAEKIQIMPRLRTGSVAFDRALFGGIPVGRTTILRGMESSGKTEKLYRIIGLAQKLCANCYRPVADLEVYEEDGNWMAKGTCDCYAGGLCETKQYPDETIPEYKARIKEWKVNSFEEFRVYLLDIEHGMDKPWATRLGVDLRRLGYSRPDTAEEAADLYDMLMRTAEVDLLALDSIAAMTPSTEVEESTVKWQQGLGARLMGKFTRKVQSSANSVAREYGRLITQIWINQEREKIGVMFGDNKVMPYGNAQLFAASVIVKCWASKWEREDVDKDLIQDFQSKTGTRVQMNFKITKNKTAPAMTDGSYKLWIGADRAGEVDEEKYILALAEKYHMFAEIPAGNKKEWRLGDEKFKTKKAALARLYEPAVYQKVTGMLLDHLLEGYV